MGLLDGKVAIVSGGGRGIGRAVSKLFALEGAHVLIVDNGSAPDGSGNNSRVAALVAEEIEAERGSAVPCFADITRGDDVNGVLDLVLSRWGRMDILFNGAGNIRLGTLLDTSIEDWNSIMRIHLEGAFRMAQMAARHWHRHAVRGRLINVTSSAVMGHTSFFAYTAAKGAVISMTRACANTMADWGATANAIAPAAATRHVDSIQLSAKEHFEKTGKLPHEEVAGTPADPAHVAPIAAWLASDGASRISGRVFSAMAGTYGLWANQLDVLRTVSGDAYNGREELYRAFDHELTQGLSIDDLTERQPYANWETWSWEGPAREQV
ncbi:SDR family NAD(P)-dependent oxidoreductase [Sphingopyxis flava]|uniref:NAD(P)-dependent dehydrogenase, short-chain alcohol dehydrogenase family n=1 Tax=Sphingopyxis flava TaxID=1507287 RepID=A0A1T5G4B8_9SPHN|nr:SDR family oxidoreductase [Sphingopyxis flava]SKC03189.1 NAD(P)-dependent dehydrogenase, short-chain alcohol dehydrogenase family [Sphingopyxis flava]